jgi:hypothetical protein
MSPPTSFVLYLLIGCRADLLADHTLAEARRETLDLRGRVSGISVRTWA